MQLRRLSAVAHEAANQRWRNTEDACAMALNQRPQTIDAGKIQRAVVNYYRGAEQSCAKNFPRPHHPTHVRHPIENVLRLDVEAEHHVLRRFDRKTTVGVQRALGSARSSRGVN